MKAALTAGILVGLLFGFTRKSKTNGSASADGVAAGSSTSSTSTGWPGSGGGQSAQGGVDWSDFSTAFSTDLGIGPNPTGTGTIILPGQLDDVESTASAFTQTQAHVSYFYDAYDPNTGTFNQTWSEYIAMMLSNFNVDWSGFSDPPGTGGFDGLGQGGL